MPIRLLTWLASGLLFVLFTAITTLVWRDRELELQVLLDQDASHLMTAYGVAVDTQEQQMLALASLLATDPEIQHLFDQGRAAVEREGGAGGGSEAARLRATLLARVQPQWRYMQAHFGVRQLHFHLGPQPHSFLRIHVPERFGDEAAGLRPMVADVLGDHQARAGFEISRVHAGVRGVVPVEIAAVGGTRLVGAIEVGSAADAQLDRLDRQLGAGFALLLKPGNVEAAIWQEYRAGQRLRNQCDCYLAASSRLEVKDWLDRMPVPSFLDKPTSWLLKHQGNTYHVTQIPLRDYLGRLDARRAAVGTVLIWRDVGALLERHRQSLAKLVAETLLGYAVSQALLLWLLHHTQGRWKLQVDRKGAALLESEARFHLLLMSLDEGVFGVDLKGCITFINPAALRLLAMSGDEVLRRDHHLLIHHHHADGSDYQPVDCPINLTLADGRSRHETEEWFSRRDGGGFPVTLSVNPVLRNGVRVGAMVIFQDDSEHHALADRLRRLATTDSLTGVGNRLHFVEHLEREMARYQRRGDPAALLMIDLDHFKRINDEYGHAAGDTVLKSFTDAAQHLLRRSDQLGRLGSEEFAILLPDTDADGARDLAERLRQRIAETPVTTASGVIHYSVSIGIAMFTHGDRDADSILARADQSLDQAKQAGRNRVEMQAG